MANGGSASTGLANDDTIGGRYRIDCELARGGMGTIYRVTDAATGRTLALKQLRVSGAQQTRMRAMFEREYQTLARIDHPRIIRVHDYGEDRDGPFYPMDVLEGSDLRDLAPLQHVEACRHLRDVAFSLALLHSRGYLHRDVTPRNIRVDATGRAKLIDFGAMAQIGAVSDVIGTPPCLPPEAWRKLPLDACSDLFGLGAVAYWVLTGRHAYPANQLNELPRFWQRPVPPPSTFAPETPQRLDELVLSLLRLEPSARPASALEVIDALDSIAELAPDEEPELAQSYLGSSPLIGRDDELVVARAALSALSEGRGSAILLTGERGIGRTRLLDELRLEALLAGCSVASADGELERGPFGLAREVALDLGQTLPKQAPRAELQKAFEDTLFAQAAARPLVLLLDNVQLADEPSATLFASLALRASDHRLCIIAAQRSHDELVAPNAVEVLASASKRCELKPLSEAQIGELLAQLFAGDSRTGRLAVWMHRASGGSPLSCREICRHLIAQGIARYAQGVWVLPSELPLDALPSNLAATLAARIRTLAPDARGLAEVLCAHRGPLPIEVLADVQALSSRGALMALDALLVRGVAAESERGFRVANEAMREALASGLDAPRWAVLHSRLGEALRARAPTDLGMAVQAAWHLMRGGKASDGADLVAELAPEIERLVLADTVSAVEAALAVYEREHRPAVEQLVLRALLGTFALAIDHRLITYGRTAVEQLADITGLALARKLRPRIGGALALGAGITWAMLRYARLKTERAPSFRRLVQLFFSTTGSVAGVSVFSGDPPALRRLAEHLTPLESLPLGNTGREMHSLIQRLLAQVQGRESDALALALRSRALLADPRNCRDLPPQVRIRLYAGVLASLGVLNVYRADSGALAVADELARLAEPMSELFSARLRMLHHVLRGEVKIAAVYAEQMERFAMRGEPMWQAEITLPLHLITAYALTSDVVGMKRTVEQLERLAVGIPSLGPFARAARAAYLARSGRTKRAVELFERALPDMPPRGMFAWAFMAGLYAGCLNELRQYQRAAAYCREQLAHVPASDRAFTAHYLELERQLAMAEAGLGDHPAAARRLDALLGELANTEQPLVLGLLHQARARVAHAMADGAALSRHFAAMRKCFAGTENAALIAQCEQLAAELMPSADLVAANATYDLLSQLDVPQERARRALELLKESTSAQAGYLYRLSDGAVVLVAAVGAPEPPEAVASAVRRALDRLESQSLTEDEQTAIVEGHGDAESEAVTSTEIVSSSGTLDPTAPSVFLLSVMQGGRSVVVGAAALTGEHHEIAAPPARLLIGIARALQEHSAASSHQLA